LKGIGFSQAVFTSYRRLWLDYFLNYFSPEIRGTVVDFGGKRHNKRGTFKPPENQAEAWWYINLELTTKPDIYADVTATPLQNESADVIVCTEVLEHIHRPQACVNEIWHILKPGGLAVVSVPFIYPVHADPNDFQRFTADGLCHLFNKFSKIEIFSMGGFWGTLGMLLEIGVPGIRGNSVQNKILRRTLVWLSRKLYALDISRSPEQNPIWQKFTTGYFIRVIK
jgi:SAM-dependent methyltransferase